MVKLKLMTLTALLLISGAVLGQSTLPKISVEKMDGTKVQIAETLNEEGPTVISFWATWCKPCILELNEMQDLYSDWTEDTNVKIIAVSVDDSRSADKVRSFVNGKGWDFEVILDKNSDLKRALNINNVPFTIILDKNKEIIWEHSGYVPGDEELVYEKLVTLE